MDLKFWRLIDLMKVPEKFVFHGNGLFLLEHPLGWKTLSSLWLEKSYFINGINPLTLISKTLYLWLILFI